jgi:hypothetical protein
LRNRAHPHIGKKRLPFAEPHKIQCVRVYEKRADDVNQNIRYCDIHVRHRAAEFFDFNIRREPRDNADKHRRAKNHRVWRIPAADETADNVAESADKSAGNRPEKVPRKKTYRISQRDFERAEPRREYADNDVQRHEYRKVRNLLRREITFFFGRLPDGNVGFL